ncbi:hypothetical protein HO173_001343 [Letharia columbiana]|uniref:Uncharacterized protein n=1 Tax=Letharia columbiana TaxID=112416 RepID=A0A8H6G5C3_9LECA|nr:uncharacterized protein HO173_001343 [Letharia columbiana]KAF6240671.1 hypothetical protein HO173_001343 [Letharia columbiana]
MRTAYCLMLQSLGASLAATVPATSLLTLYNGANINLTLPPNSALLSNPSLPSELGVPAPAAPYYIEEGRAFLKFYDYGAALPPAPAQELLRTASDAITHGHGVDSYRKVGREVIYSQTLDAGAGVLWLSVEPEANMTWGEFETAVMGAGRFLRRWDNVEFAVDVEMRMEAGGKVGTVYLSRY